MFIGRRFDIRRARVFVRLDREITFGPEHAPDAMPIDTDQRRLLTRDACGKRVIRLALKDLGGTSIKTGCQKKARRKDVDQRFL